ncbi:MAG: DUF4332 domain-containing protein [Candidatus Thermoplasmatota archaeon]|nr:DUF4332 domain-containing protein [Candidatus Thermoplasmatota archaeon]
MKITELKGIGPQYGKKLKRAGIKTIYDLREMNVKKVAEASKIGEQLLKKWKDSAMKMHLLTDIKGIGNAFRKKLEKQGIFTVEELSRADKGIADKIGISEKKFKAWIKDANKMVGKKISKRAVVAEKIGADNAFITIKGKKADVKIKEKVHEEIPVFRGKLDDVVKENSMTVNIDNSGNVRLWFNGKWYDNIPATEESLWSKIKRIFWGAK